MLLFLSFCKMMRNAIPFCVSKCEFSVQSCRPLAIFTTVCLNIYFFVEFLFFFIFPVDDGTKISFSLLGLRDIFFGNKWPI